MVHLLENTGDPWRDYCNHMGDYMGYGDCVYFLLITMSTVSLGSVFWAESEIFEYFKCYAALLCSDNVCCLLYR